MEFFERAHVAKGKELPRKESKSEENVKKQLKQMLYGYKQSDNELIKQSADVKTDFDDSSSVSRFSDLNITNSSIECETTQGTISPNFSEVSLSDDDDHDLSQSPKMNVKNDIESISVESISDYKDYAQSLSDDLDPEITDDSMSNASEDVTFNTSFFETSTDDKSDDSVSFDRDGILAAKILENLGITEKIKLKKSKKRKLDEVDSKVSLNLSFTSDEAKVKGPFLQKVIEKESKHKGNNEIQGDSLEYKGPYRPKFETSDLYKIIEKGESIISVDNISEHNSTIDSDSSSPFVLVSATEMESQNLSDILGKYRHSTIKNIPSESQNYVANSSGMFVTEDATIADLNIDDETDEVNSLIPEIDETIDDIDLDAIEFDDSTQPNDETTAYDDTLQSEQISEREQSTESISPTLINPIKVYYGNNNCIFVLKHPEELFIHGKARVQRLGGTVEILGHILQDQPCEIYAPNYNYAQCIRTVERQNVYYGLFGKLTSAGLTVSEAEEIVTTLGQNDGVVSLESLKSKKMDYVDTNFSVKDLFSKMSKNVDNSLKKASELLGCSLYLTKPWKSFEENVSWKQAIKCGMNNKSRGILCGGKGTGKSTFLRYYVNKLLASGPVLVVDVDPGQCEFTPAGNLSATVVTEPLLGPNFTHLKTPEKMLNVGMINTMDNPRRYAAAVESLITHCSTDDRLQNMPWIVNTMGMCNTMGLKFTTLLIIQIQPTFLLQIDSKNPKKRYDYHLYPQTVRNLYFEDYQHDRLFKNVTNVENLYYSFFISHHTENSVKNNFSLPPRDERYLNFLAYFGELVDLKSGGLLDITPYEVNLKDLKIGVNVKIDQDAVTKVINGKVVALCQQDAAAGDNRRVFTLGDKPLRCHGHGLIRGIDWARGVLFIITPVPADRLVAVNVLVYADWVPELRGPEKQLPPGTAVPYRTATLYQQRQLMFAPKRRFNPLQLLKMSRSS